MKQLSSAQVRQMWLDFWASKGHSVEPSVSLVPVNDPTLLWINSGVATLKKYFDGTIKPENPRMAFCALVIRGFSGLIVPSKYFLRVATPELIHKSVGSFTGTKLTDGSTE